MAIIDMYMDGTVAVIRLNNGENRHHLEFAQTLNQMLERVIADETVTAMVMTSTDEKNWSQGIDLEWMMKQFAAQKMDTVVEFLMTMDRVFRQLLTYPIPAVAAITGHCFANAAILAAAFDYRFMRTDRGFYCLPEVDINIQFAPAMKTMLFHKYSNPVAYQLMLTGRRLTAPEAERAGIVQKACNNAAETLAEAIAFAKSQQKLRSTFGLMKAQINQPVIHDLYTLNPPYFTSRKSL